MVHRIRPCRGILNYMYTQKQMSARQIAEKFCATSSTVHGWLRFYEIETRRKGGNFRSPNIAKEQILELWTPEMDLLSIASALGISATKLAELCRKYRLTPKSVINKYGECNGYGPNWEQQRIVVRKRDNHACRRCGITEAELECELDVHHIRKFRYFDSYLEANVIDNLVSLCWRCHDLVEWNGVAIPENPNRLLIGKIKKRRGKRIYNRDHMKFLINGGLTKKRAAEVLGCSYRHLADVTPPTKPRISEEEKQEILKLYKSGLGTRDIENIVGRSRIMIRRHLCDMLGIKKLRGRNQFKSGRENHNVIKFSKLKQNIIALHEQGMMHKDIAAKLGCHISTVSRHSSAHQKSMETRS